MNRAVMLVRMRRIFTAGAVAVLALGVLTPTSAQAATKYKAGCKTTIATFTMSEDHIPQGILEHRLVARKCWNTTGNLTSTSLTSDVTTIWAGKAIGYSTQDFTPYKRTGRTDYSLWIADGRAQMCVVWYLCASREDWRFNVNFYAPSFKGNPTSPTQAAAFMFEKTNSTNWLKIKSVTATTF